MTDRHSDPAKLAHHADAPIRVCRLIFAAAEGCPEIVALIRSDATDHETLRLRRAIIWAAKFHTDSSLPAIGRALNRDHSAVHRGLIAAKMEWLNDAEFRGLAEQVAARARVGSLCRGTPEVSATG